MKKVKVDKSACISCGFCVGAAPDVFEFDENMLSTPKKDVVDEVETNAETAQEGCPTGAITLEDAEEKK